jgi:hypothetical protein
MLSSELPWSGMENSHDRWLRLELLFVVVILARLPREPGLPTPEYRRGLVTADGHQSQRRLCPRHLSAAPTL